MAAMTAEEIESQIRRMTPVAASDAEQTEAERLHRLLEGLAGAGKRRRAKCEIVSPGGERVSLPEPVFFVLERVAELFARGDAVTVVPVAKELTTQQAADMLNVSRQYLVRLLEEGRLPFTKTGTHRRLRIEDVIAFKEQRDAERRDALRELSTLTEDFGGYDRERS